MRYVFWSALFLLAASVSLAKLDPTPPFSYLGIHACPSSFVSGLHVGENIFACTYDFTPKALDVAVIDGDDEPPTQCEASDEKGKVKMHCCPEGYAIQGVHVGKNLLLCTPYDRADVDKVVGKRGWTRKLDRTTQVYWGNGKMHGCPDAMPMLGLHVDSNVLLCMAKGTE